MNKKSNIEELFKSKLDNFEAPVNDAMWANISNGIGSSAVGTTASLASKLFSTTGIAITTGLISTAITVFVMSSGNENAVHTPKEAERENKTIPITPKEEISANTINDDELAVSNIINYTNSESKEKANQPEKENFIIIPSVSKDEKADAEKKAPNSAVYSFLTPSNKRYADNQKDNDASVPSSVNDNKAPVKEITVIEAEPDELIATIIASPVGGYAPLDVYFSNPATRGSVHWDFGDGTSSDEVSPAHTFEKYGKFTVELTIIDENGDTRKDFRVIEVLANSAITEIPNVFTPNNDGINDLCTVKGKNLEVFQMKVFNRSGNVIFATESLDRAWDGKDKFGQDIPTGTYFYLISARGIDGKVYEHTGQITLSR